MLGVYCVCLSLPGIVWSLWLFVPLLVPKNPLRPVAIFNCFVLILFTLVFNNKLWSTFKTIKPMHDGKHIFLSLCVNGIPDDKLLIPWSMKKDTCSSIFSDAKANMLYDLELQRTGFACLFSLDTNPPRPERQGSPPETILEDWHHFSYIESNNIERLGPFLFWESPN